MLDMTAKTNNHVSNTRSRADGKKQQQHRKPTLSAKSTF